ncbi:unnamed protein product [Rhizoctonia solani]|uniref:Uncharacterized protein n=1 Tax=Rhizoctonia solani TaxID=456999 RepID=A0A8H3D2Y5_9AGAM|nr:unnamed protein product [Rhizoctonia solani]
MDGLRVPTFRSLIAIMPQYLGLPHSEGCSLQMEE